MASIQRGLAPVSIGLPLAGCLTIGKAAVTGWVTVIITIVVFILLLRTKINPALLILCAAVVGLVAFGHK